MHLLPQIVTEGNLYTQAGINENNLFKAARLQMSQNISRKSIL
jgi:hypothetical protein